MFVLWYIFVFTEMFPEFDSGFKNIVTLITHVCTVLNLWLPRCSLNLTLGLIILLHWSHLFALKNI